MFARYKKLLSYIGPFKKRRIFIIIICSISIIVGSLTPYLIGDLINYISKGDGLDLILRQASLALVVSLGDAILNSYQNYQWHLFSVEYINYFRTLMLKAGLSKDVGFFSKKDEDYGSRILQDSVNIAQDISIGLPMLILNVLRLGIVIFLMVKMSFKLSLIPLTIIPIYILVFHRINKGLRENSKKEREGYSLISNLVNEYLRGIFEIKINNKESYFIEKFKEKIRAYTKSLRKIRFLTAISYGVSTIITGALPIIVLLVGGIMVYRGNLEIGFLFSFYAYLDFLYEPMNNLVDWYTNINISMGMSDRVLDFLSYDIKDDEGKPISSIEKIEVEDLSFSYGEKELFKDLNFSLKKGDCLAVVGRSGSGKSTLIDILLKNLDSYKGEIKVNDLDLREVDKKDYFSNISLISQEVFIFTDSLSENIAYGGDISEDSDIFRKAKLKDFLKDRKSLASLVSADSLSGGEKQRIGLARVLYKNSDLVILDEFTSALDKAGEREIVDSLMAMDKKDKIYIVISHRDYPLKMANKILDLNDGSYEILS